MKPELIKIIVAGLLFVCLLKMPYGYFQFVRFVATIAFILLAIESYKRGAKLETYIFVILAFLFQPIIKVALGRLIWNIVDMVVAIGLLSSLFLLNRHNATRQRK